VTCDGRAILGLGASWYEPEYRAFGFPYDDRVGRFEEALQIIRELLHGRMIDFQGQYYQARECELRPCGPRPTALPTLIGARRDRPRALQITAEYADYSTQADTAEDVSLARQPVRFS
jgi:alkanesulfonate monooxygenase SsuD/methylene tetrahydromethanopterin reductase-like flavin-dependent oxidoreductase (luciferase family)